MATFTRFEDIEGWKKGRELAREVYLLTLKGVFARDFGRPDQIRRAAVSVMANIAEGFGRGGNKEFVAFQRIARGSGAEVKSPHYVALDAGLWDRNAFDAIDQLADETEGLISGLMKCLTASGARGRKFVSVPTRKP